MKTTTIIIRSLVVCLILCLPLLSTAQNKIYGGAQIDIKETPYQVSIELDGNHFCGGTIISDRWILTAGHCVKLFNSPIFAASRVRIHAGSTDQTDNTIGQVIQADSIFLHPSYTNVLDTLENDVALIYLTQPLQFNHSVMPIEYATPCNTDSMDYALGNRAFLSGWGRTCQSCPLSPTLKGVLQPMIHIDTAFALNISQSNLFTTSVSDNMISFHELGSGSGGGDSGGPAVIDKNGNKINIGVSSWGFWPKDQLPSIYVNVLNYASWIESVTGLTINSPGVDLYTKDKPWDMGFKPFSYQYPWTSEDIWIRNQNDTIEVHENPEFSLANDSVYVKVRIRNRGCMPSNGNEVLKLYWAKASTSLAWPNNWNGNVSVSNVPLGGELDSVVLPVIQPGDAYIATIPWLPPNPATYAAIANNPIFFANQPHHFCLLSRIESTVDTMTFIETTSTMSNVLNNNNIAWKNLSVVDIDSTNLTGPVSGNDIAVGATILVGDPEGVGGIFNVKFCDLLEAASIFPVSEHAEVKVTLDDLLWQRWEMTNFDGENIEILDVNERQLLIGNGCGVIKNISFQPEEFSLIHMSFNFLIEDYTQLKPSYNYTVILTNNEGKIFGGGTYEINNQPRSNFNAEAGQDVEILEGEYVQLSALQINEGAIYNWYDINGELIFTGPNFSVSPEVSQTYTLEVIAELDGYKDYDEVAVEVKKNYISSMSPNPASSQVDLTYVLDDAVQSAYLVLVQNQTNTSNQYILNTTQNSRQINTSGLNNGIYALILVVDGVTVDYKNLLIAH